MPAPDLLTVTAKLVARLLKSGCTRFSEAIAMVGDQLGEQAQNDIRPYLARAWNTLRKDGAYKHLDDAAIYAELTGVSHAGEGEQEAMGQDRGSSLFGMSNVSWENVQDACPHTFSILMPDFGGEWARAMWEALRKEGLTAYPFGDEVEHHRVYFRFLALGAIYHDFMQQAIEELSNLDYPYWAEGLNLNPEVIANMHACWSLTNAPDSTESTSDEDEDEDEDADDDSMPNSPESMLSVLVEDARSTVVEALVKQLGSAQELYVSLWEAKDRTTRKWLDDEQLAALGKARFVDDPFRPVTADRMAAYEWVLNGCDRIGECEWEE